MRNEALQACSVKCKEYGLLKYNKTESDTDIHRTFWINLLPPSSGQKNKDGGSMFLYQTAQGYISAQETNYSPY
jgi:hypothetical protein